MEITAEMVKVLREETGAGIMDCKRALQEAGGNSGSCAVHPQGKGICVGSQEGVT